MPFDSGRNPFSDPVAMTLADVVACVAADATPTARRKGEILSAVNSTALWLQRTPGEIPANHEYLRRAFQRLNFATLGVGLARVRNVQSLLKPALAIAGVPTSRQSYLAPMTAVWQVLSHRIPDSYARECLARLMQLLQRSWDPSGRGQ